MPHNRRKIFKETQNPKPVNPHKFWRWLKKRCGEIFDKDVFYRHRTGIFTCYTIIGFIFTVTYTIIGFMFGFDIVSIIGIITLLITSILLLFYVYYQTMVEPGDRD